MKTDVKYKLYKAVKDRNGIIPCTLSEIERSFIGLNFSQDSIRRYCDLLCDDGIFKKIKIQRKNRKSYTKYILN
jgi:hypothetical protein